MKIFVTVLLFLAGIQLTSAQQAPFVGKLVYSVQIADTNMRDMFESSEMKILTNDTILRIETTTASLGKQILIQHIALKKAYLLIESPIGKFAIQIPEKTDSIAKFSFKKAKGKKIISGLESKNLEVNIKGVEQAVNYYYHDKISAKYLPGFEMFPGLLTEYFVSTVDGLYNYQLIEVKPLVVPRDMFGIPSDFKRISMSDFVDRMTNMKEPNMEEEK